jgi:hypothetical protein
MWKLAVLDFKNACSRTMKGVYTPRAEADERFPIFDGIVIGASQHCAVAVVAPTN